MRSAAASSGASASATASASSAPRMSPDGDETPTSERNSRSARAAMLPATSSTQASMRIAFHAMTAIAIGDPAPDFTLEGTDRPFTLSEHRGEVVVLLFYPGDETPVCTKQFCSYRDTGLEGLGATVVGISAQDLESHQRFTSHHGLTVPLLADADKKVAKAYGMSIPVVGTRRAVFV